MRRIMRSTYIFLGFFSILSLFSYHLYLFSPRFNEDTMDNFHKQRIMFPQMHENPAVFQAIKTVAPRGMPIPDQTRYFRSRNFATEGDWMHVDIDFIRKTMLQKNMVPDLNVKVVNTNVTQSTTKLSRQKIKVLSMTRLLQNHTQSSRPLQNHTQSSRPLQNHTQSSRPLQNHTQSSRPLQNHTRSSERFLIYLCDQTSMCGGWADRQRGLVSVFLLAGIMGRRFGINMTQPCPITLFYLPNKVNWVITEDEIRGKITREIQSVNVLEFHVSLRNITVAEFDRLYPEDVIFLRSNEEHYWTLRGNPYLFPKKFPQWCGKSGRDTMFPAAWKLLMKPSPRLQENLDAVLDGIGYRNRTHSLVCAHVRMGYNPIDMPEDYGRNEKRDLKELDSLWNFLEPYIKNGSHLFLASDSSEVRSLSKKRFTLAHHDTGGIIMHSDQQRSSPNVCVGFEYALLDQLVLVHCDILVMSVSGFSLRAAFIRGHSRDVYQYSRGKVIRIEQLH